MGAAFDTAIVVAETREEVLRRYDDIQSRKAHESGNCYSGTLASARGGLKFKGGPWDKDEAYEHCLENHPKWERAWAYHLDDGSWFIGAWCSS